MSVTSELAEAERRLARMVSVRADAEERQARADKAERVRADDLRCRDLAAEYQGDYQGFGVSPPLPGGNEWSDDYERRLVKGLQRRLSPRNSYADDSMLDGLRGKAFDNIARTIRDEAAQEAASPCPENLPESVSDPRAMVDRTDAMGQRRIEFRARTSFIKEMNAPAQRVVRLIGKGGDVIFGPPFPNVRDRR